MKNRALKYTIGFAAMGFVITLLILYVQRNMLNTYQRNMPYINLGDNIKNRTTKGHLWFEEIMAGDKSISFENDVLPKFVSSRDILQATYEGRETELGVFEKSNDENTKAILKESIKDIEHLIEAANERWQLSQQQVVVATSDSTTTTTANTSALAGGAQDQKFDASYEEFQSTMDQLVDHVSKKLAADSAYLNTVSWVSIGLIIVSFIILCSLLYRLQHGNDRMAAENQVRLEGQAGAVTQLSDFVDAVSAGNFAVDLVLSGDDGGLTHKLITMRDRLKENAENEKKRSWSTMGAAQIGEILRATNMNAADLYDSIIQFVVKYTKSNQGGLFILSDDEGEHKALDLVACYAYERKKFLTKKVDVGEGLVGQCFIEGQRIYLIDVPKEYISITSGLGGATPSSLLIVPMKLNDKIYGVIELASFHPYQEFEIELVEKLAESIASTISTVRINESTRVLLEKTQEQTEEMKAQEEEIRQNMEELEATQEEMRRKATILEKELLQSQEQAIALQAQEKKLTESQDTLQAIVDNIPRAIFWKDKDLRFVGCNKIFSDIAGLPSPREIFGKTDFDMAWSAQADAYRKDDLEVMKKRNAKLDIEEVNINSDGAESWVLTSKVPIIDHNNEVVAILGMFEDITQRKHREADVAKKLIEREEALKEIQHLKRVLEAKG